MIKYVRLDCAGTPSLIADVVLENETVVRLSKPIQLYTDYAEGATEGETLVMMPYLPTTIVESTEIELKRSSVLFTLTPKKDMIELYETYAERLYRDRSAEKKELEELKKTKPAQPSDDDFLSFLDGHLPKDLN